MEFGSTPKRSKLDSGHVNVAHEDFSDDLPFYSFPPTGKIDLIEVDDMVNERLSILEVFEELKISEIGQSKNLADHLGTIRERLKQIESKFGDNFITTLHARTLGAHNTLKKDARRRDQISHFLLRLYFCHPQEKKTWFVNRETELLRYRLLEETVGKAATNALSGQKNDSSVVAQMILKNNLNYEPIHLGNSDYDRDLRRKASFNNLFVTNDDKSPFYRILFEDALDVVRMRKAYLQDGYAYVSTHDMISLICTKFRQELNTALSRLNMRRSDEEHRLLPIINNIYLKKIASARKLKADASGKLKEVVTPDMIDNLALEHFPPCMESIHLNLRKNHHIKYGGRLHYGLFLKGIGLSLEDAVKFFRDEFIQKLAPEKFDKEYRYGIRYNYGKEGKKVDFSPYGCEKIINSTPGVGDAHGCPFKHFDWTNLKKFLVRKGVGDEVLQNIESLVEEKNYSKACGIYFTVRHPSHQISDEGITHPNTFYAESRKALQRNPKREDLILEDEIDHFTGSFLPEEETLNQDVTQEMDENVPEVPEAPGAPEVPEAPEPMDSSEMEQELTSVDPDQSAIEESIVEKEHHKLTTIIERLDDPKETETDNHVNEPEQ